MKRIGSVLHISSNKNIILRAENLPKIGEKVVDKRLRSVGVVFDIFGPLTSPYVAVKPDFHRPEVFNKKELYTISSSKTKRRKRG